MHTQPSSSSICGLLTSSSCPESVCSGCDGILAAEFPSAGIARSRLFFFSGCDGEAPPFSATRDGRALDGEDKDSVCPCDVVSDCCCRFAHLHEDLLCDGEAHRPHPFFACAPLVAPDSPGVSCSSVPLTVGEDPGKIFDGAEVEWVITSSPHGEVFHLFI